MPTQTSGGFAGYDNQNFKRNVIKGDLTKYWGSHTIKTGGDYEDINAVVDRFEGGAGQRIYQAPYRRRPGSSTTGTGTT